MKKAVKFMSLFFGLVLVMSVFPGAVFASFPGTTEQEPTVTPRASYSTCDRCGKMTLRGTPGPNVNMGDNLVEGCPFYPNQVHMHEMIMTYTNYYCTSCGYSCRDDYRIVQSICLA